MLNSVIFFSSEVGSIRIENIIIITIGKQSQVLKNVHFVAGLFKSPEPSMQPMPMTIIVRFLL